MKRERPEEKHHHSNGGFYHSHHQFNLHSPPPPPPHLHRQSPTPESSDSHDSTKIASHDGASIEVARRPRGRPPGSKNKPKPLIIPSQDASEPSMGPYILELATGVDVIETTLRFCRRRNTGLCVLNGHGLIEKLVLRQPSSDATVTFQGRFDILSISATVYPGGESPPGNGSFTVFLAGPRGQVIGGVVAGPLMSAGTVYLIAATFNSPQFQRLPAADHDGEAVADDEGYDRRESPPVSGADSGGAPVYCYYPETEAEGVWAPTARHPPPY